MQYGKLYKMTEIILFAMLNLLKVYKYLLTFLNGYDMIIMLGRLLAAPFRMFKIVV